MLTIRWGALAAATTVSLLTLTGCDENFGPPGPSRTETRSVDLDNCELVRAELKMGAGDLHAECEPVETGAERLLVEQPDQKIAGKSRSA